MLEKQNLLFHGKGNICGHFSYHLLNVLICTYKKLHIIVLDEITYKNHRVHWKCSINISISVFLYSIPFQMKKVGPPYTAKPQLTFSQQ